MSESIERICVLGLGYIGLPTASFLATEGYEVVGVDIRPDVVETVNRGRMHIKEPDLDVLVKSAVQSGHLRAALEPAPADVFVIAVPTPFRDGHQPDLSKVEAATANLAPHLRPGNLVILESTSPIGTTERVAAQIRELRSDLEVGGVHGVKVAHCPERVLPGRILRELVENDRIVGGIDAASADAVRDFYARFVSGRILTTDARTAELAKLTENAFRDVNIAFANELSVLCERFGIEVSELIRLANCHPRVNILQPGPGVGGHCIAVDPWFIVHSAPDITALIRTARETNDGKAHFVVRKVGERAAGFERPRIACLGLTYKPNVDDTRESPALWITRQLCEIEGAEILAVDPYLAECPPELRGPAALRFTQAEEAIDRADIVLALVGHDQFRALPRELLDGKIVIDTCGLWP